MSDKNETIDIRGRTNQVKNILLKEINRESYGDDISSDELSSIESLFIRFNGIESLKEDDFDGLTGLRQLDLGYNRLKDLPSNIFDGLDNLEEVNLENNIFNKSSIKKIANLFKKIKLNFDNQVKKNVDKGIGIGD